MQQCCNNILSTIVWWYDAIWKHIHETPRQRTHSPIAWTMVVGLRYPEAKDWNGNPCPDTDPDPNAKLMLAGQAWWGAEGIGSNYVQFVSAMYHNSDRLTHDALIGPEGSISDPCSWGSSDQRWQFLQSHVILLYDVIQFNKYIFICDKCVYLCKHQFTLQDHGLWKGPHDFMTSWLEPHQWPGISL